MKNPDMKYDIRKARIVVENRESFIRTVQEIAHHYSTHIVCFDSDKMSGRDHVEAALHHAQRSFFSKKSISNSFEMEALLFAAGSRQCNTASLFGIHEGENTIYICIYPVRGNIWNDLSHHMHFLTEDRDELVEEKVARLMSLFNISQHELELVGTDRLRDLILERIALLEVYR